MASSVSRRVSARGVIITLPPGVVRWRAGGTVHDLVLLFAFVLGGGFFWGWFSGERKAGRQKI